MPEYADEKGRAQAQAPRSAALEALSLGEEACRAGCCMRHRISSVSGIVMLHEAERLPSLQLAL